MDSIYDENQARFKGFSLMILFISILALAVSTYLWYSSVGPEDHERSLELVHGSIILLLMSFWFKYQAYRDNNFHPKFKVGETVIYNPKTGFFHHHREFPFTKNIDNVPKYVVHALEEHSILLYTDSEEEPLRVYFSDQTDLFTIEEFQKQALKD